MKRKRTTKRPMGSTLLGRFDNFIIKKISNGEGNHIRISTADGNWKTDFSEDNMRYAWILMCLSNKNAGVQKALEMWIVSLYHIAHIFPDAEFFEEIYNSLSSLEKRNIERFKPDMESEETD